MAYLTVAQAKQILGTDMYESAYIDITTDLASTTILQEDIDYVSDIIDGYLKRIYNTAVTGAASLRILKGLAEDLLIHKAYTRFDQANIPDTVTANYDRVIFRLKDIASGAFPLPDEVQNHQDSKFNYAFETGVGATGQTNAQVFNRGNMSSY